MNFKLHCARMLISYQQLLIYLCLYILCASVMAQRLHLSLVGVESEWNIILLVDFLLPPQS